MQLTDDQQAAAAAFTAFMVSPDKEMVISGPAGTGKSTLLKHLMASQDHIKIQQLLGESWIEDWRLTATTNKAAEVLQDSAGEEARTVHSLLGITVRPDFKTGRQIMTRKNNAEVLSSALLVVDECSMIDRQLDQFIDQSTFNCKILYVGDHCQLAPVMEDLSPVFKRNTPIELKQIVRSQHTPAITALSNQLREIVETGVFTKIQGEPGYIDYLTPEQAEREITHYFVDNADTLGMNSRILAYRNAQVHDFNAWVREKRGMPPGLTEDEWVVSNGATILQGSSGQRLRIEQDVFIQDIGSVTTFQVGSGATAADVSVRRVLTSGGTVLVAEDTNHVAALLKHYSKQKAWEPFYQLKENLADLRPRDACTVHKSQGSTYRTVFVDLKDIGRCTNANQAARMLYVACSRATHRICFIGDLPGRFKGE